MKKNIDIYPNTDQPDELLVQGKCTAQEALDLAKKEYPVEATLYTIKNVQPIKMQKCLDDGYLNVTVAEGCCISDDVCGECGEYRLSKRLIDGWWIH